ncbi:membrane protein insertion efficiency factor YidD [Actinomyces sp. B33]|uniref:membrane protein insertion efficiency factor YidD n=1 Tax=Actinomyces sp. B33 TaxID=2942131 RepID=UPI0023423DFB|nr:membrane protein insertion efficiency factor YidD [Actinomyces sp. B33]MDC4232542.1 membrane protein insertion efficiency factor YidD [Actinomyces sp. B33]
MSPLSALIRGLAVAPIRLYQKLISPMIGPRCRYAPTCSTYAIEAIGAHGVVKGMLLASWRLLRCNPWSLGGVDRVPERGRWTPDPWIPPDDWAGNATDIVRPVPMGLASVLPATDEGGPALVPPNEPASAATPAGAPGARHR